MIKKIIINLNRLKTALLSNTHLTLFIAVLKLVRPITNLIDFFASLFISKQKKTSSKFILICAPPRSGSTFIYQVITQVLNSIYFSNLHELFPRLTSSLFFKNTYKDNNLKILRNYYGYTNGLSGVNEGNTLIDYWFKTKDNQGIRRRFLETIKWLSNKSGAPIIIKNVGIYDRLMDLYQAVPELIIVYVTRDPQQISESTLKAYYELGYFNPIPKNMENSAFDNPAKFAVDQFLTISRVLNNQLKKIPNKNIINLPYEKFCKNPNFYIELIAKNVQTTQNLNLINDTIIKASRSRKVSDRDSKKIKYYLTKARNRIRMIN